MDVIKYQPCQDGLEYYKSKSDFITAWNDCQRGDWMLWMAQKLRVDKRILTLAKGKCAETVKHLMKDERSRKAVEVAIDYGEGKATDEELKNAAYSAASAAYADAYAAYADASAASAAASAASAAAYAAYADASAAYADASAAYAAYAAAYADASAAIIKNRLQTADICRQILTDAVNVKLKNGVENG